MNIVQRAKAPTPKFFKVLRTIGLAMLAVSGTLLTAPITLPAALVGFAGYAAVAGGVLTAVSQVTVETSTNKETDEILKELQDKTQGKDSEINSE